MKLTVIWINLLLMVCVHCCFADDAIQLVPSFNSCSVYLKADSQADKCKLEYRQEGQSQWITGLELVQSENNPTLRCSILGLVENQTYDVRITTDAKVYEHSFGTWSSEVPIAKTIVLKELPATLSERGTAKGWIRYVAPEGLIAKPGSESAILIENMQYVILEDIKIQGGDKYAIHVKNSDYVRILNCDISQWGRSGKLDLARQGRYYDNEKHLINNDAGVFIDQSLGVVVERCYIHDPNGTANPWAFAHPAGPNAVFVHARGQTVIRYNDLIGSDKHRWNDAIEGNRNGFDDGGFCRDADIYGNMILLGNDDSVELDGGQMNVRVWGNHFSNSLCGVSTAPCLIGPTYIFNNLFNNFADQNGLAGNAIKNNHQLVGQGKIYLFNNTLDTQGGISSFSPSDKPRNFITSRNNVMVYSNEFCGGSIITEQNNMDHDLIWSDEADLQKEVITNLTEYKLQANALFTRPQWADARNGNYQLQSGSPGCTQAVPVPGVSQAGQTIGITDTMPLRPTSLTLSRTNLEFDQALSQTITAILPDGNSDFTIQQNSAFDWFKVTPPHGTFQVGKPVTLTVTLADDAPNAPRRLKGCFTVKLANGYSRPVTLYSGSTSPHLPTATDPHMVCFIEAENGKSNQTLKIVSDAAASNHKAIDLPDAADKALDLNQLITFTFEIPEDGKYYLGVRTKAYKPTGLHNSIYFSLDGTPHVREELWSTGDWFWCGFRSLSYKNRAQFAPIKLTKGVHTISITPRESLQLDCFAIATDPRVFFPASSASPAP
jgi:hypothetical protein